MTSWRTAWRSMRTAAGLSDVRFHDGRHTAITTLAEKGLPDWVIQAQVGHVAPEMNNWLAALDDFRNCLIREAS